MKTTNNKRNAVTTRNLMVGYLLVAVIFFSGMPPVVNAQNIEPAPEFTVSEEKYNADTPITDKRSKMSVSSYSELRAMADEGAGNPDGVLSANTVGGDSYIVLNVEFKSIAARRALFTDLRRSNMKGAHVLTAHDKFADVFIESEDQWDLLEANPNVLRVEFDTEITVPPPPDAVTVPGGKQSVPEQIVRNGHMNLNGTGVTIAIVDTGIDFRHPDFIKYDAQGRPTSRIKFIWDTATPYQPGRGMKSPVLFPNGTSIGTLYTQAHLTAELRKPTQTIPATDIDGHGTACASVAAGNGNADFLPTGLKRPEVRGVAPAADLIGVRMGYTGFENSFVLSAAAEWLDKAAGVAPMILSGSFGGQYSGHDGQTIRERHLNARFPLTKAKRAMVIAAGNDGSRGIHAMANLNATGKMIRWNSASNGVVKFFFNNADPIEVIGTTTTKLERNIRDEVNPITNQRQITLGVVAGQGGVEVRNASGKATEVHAYLLSNGGGFYSPERTLSHLVGSPGAAENALTIGSYDWNDSFANSTLPQAAPCLGPDNKLLPVLVKWLSCYSSPGPNRSVGAKKGANKPEIVAPGQYYTSANARSNGVTMNSRAVVDPTGYYRRMNGTSAATPYTSGVIALMFQKKPALTFGQVRTALISKASKTGLNPFIDTLPNKDWGYGKLDLAAVNAILSGI